jgi:hypothetical protein
VSFIHITEVHTSWLVRGAPSDSAAASDGMALYRSRRAAGALFQTVLRGELCRRLDIEWLAVHDDVAEVAGVCRRVCRWFSKRRIEIEAELERLGQSGPAAAQAATLATRPPPVMAGGVSLTQGVGEQDLCVLGEGAPSAHSPPAAKAEELLGSSCTDWPASCSVASLRRAATRMKRPDR